MTPPHDLHRLAAMYGVQTTYESVDGSIREASHESLVAVLQALGAPVERPEDAAAAMRARTETLRQRVVEPVVVAWEGALGEVPLRLPVSQRSATAHCELLLEDGERRAWQSPVAASPAKSGRGPGGLPAADHVLTLPTALPPGYHQLTVEVNGRRAECLVIAAPRTAFRPAAVEGRREWGVFLPLYALRRDGKRRSGDLSDLEELLQWAGQQGASYVATLPILAGDLALEAGPYAPNSQCWWNEFYLDLTRIPEFSAVPGAQVLMDQLSSRLPPAHLAARRVDYGLESRLQSGVLDMLAAAFFTADPCHRRESFALFRSRNAEVELYARFRAAQETNGRDWRRWPQAFQDNPAAGTVGDEAVYRRHVFAQWNLEQQIGQLASHAENHGMTWYLDLPLGSSPTGYDAWRHRELFAEGASAGAPPDAFFSKGQNWGIPPLRPDRLREHRYGYFIEVLRRHMRHAGLLRLDHAMRLERLFWVPAAMDADQGVYVRYPVEEMFAILILESHRTRTRLIFENLGTVSDDFDERLVRHAIDGTYVLPFEVEADDSQPPIHPVPPASAARLNTHDTPLFAAFFTGLDIDDRMDLGLLDETGAQRERAERQQVRRRLADSLHQEGWLPEWTLDPELMLEALLAFLAASPSHLMTVNLEDLWLETRPQNTPGTTTERPNWQRQAKYSLETFSRLPAVLRMLRTVDRLRQHPREQT